MFSKGEGQARVLCGGGEIRYLAGRQGTAFGREIGKAAFGGGVRFFKGGRGGGHTAFGEGAEARYTGGDGIWCLEEKGGAVIEEARGTRYLDGGLHTVFGEVRGKAVLEGEGGYGSWRGEGQRDI